MRAQALTQVTRACRERAGVMAGRAQPAGAEDMAVRAAAREGDVPTLASLGSGAGEEEPAGSDSGGGTGSSDDDSDDDDAEGGAGGGGAGASGEVGAAGRLRKRPT
jgi:hypothetical protein